jgi:hypothetical protein
MIWVLLEEGRPDAGTQDLDIYVLLRQDCAATDLEVPGLEARGVEPLFG